MPLTKQQYMDRVSKALTLSEAGELDHDDYIDALEMLHDEIAGLLDAAKEEADGD